MPNKKLLLVVIFFMAAIVSFVFFPASWIFNDSFQQLKKHWPALEFSDHESVWSKGAWSKGFLKNVHLVVRGYPIELDKLSWQYQWSSTFSSRFCFALSSSHPVNQVFARACYDRGREQLVFSHFQLISNAVELGNIMGLNIEGKISADFYDVIFSKQALKGINGQAKWENAFWDMGSKKIDLGNVSAVINHDKNNARLTIENASSPISLQFLTSISQEGLLSTHGYVDVGQEKNESLITTLNFISQQKVGDRFFFKSTSTLH